jgi:hypothetical protein
MVPADAFRAGSEAACLILYHKAGKLRIDLLAQP